MAAIMKQDMQQMRALIMEHCGYTEDELNELIFNTAYRYLEDVLALPAAAISAHTANADFWSWWQLEWNRIDKIFNNNVYADPRPPYALCAVLDRENDILYAVYSAEQLRHMYEQYHEASMRNRHMNSAIVRTGFKFYKDNL